MDMSNRATHIKASKLLPGDSFRLPSGADTFDVLALSYTGDKVQAHVKVRGERVRRMKPETLQRNDTIILVAP